MKSPIEFFLGALFWKLQKQIILLPENWGTTDKYTFLEHWSLPFFVTQEKTVCYTLLNQLPSTSPPEEAIFERLKYVVPTTSFFVSRSLQKKKKKRFYLNIMLVITHRSKLLVLTFSITWNASILLTKTVKTSYKSGL